MPGRRRVTTTRGTNPAGGGFITRSTPVTRAGNAYRPGGTLAPTFGGGQSAVFQDPRSGTIRTSTSMS